jgi:ankyrin repeat protein
MTIMDMAQEFIEAIKAGDTVKVEELLDQDAALVNAKSENGVSAVLLAIYYGRLAIGELLITRGVLLNIFEASAAGKVDHVKKLADEQPDLVNAYADDGFQPLGLASFFGHKEVAELLLSKGAQVNSASKNVQRVMPLHSAVAGGHVAIAKTLLARGADVNARQTDNFSPLHGVAQNGQLEMVKLLLAHGAEVNAKGGGRTPLVIALEQGHPDVADLLRQQGGRE